MDKRCLPVPSSGERPNTDALVDTDDDTRPHNIPHRISLYGAQTQTTPALVLWITLATSVTVTDQRDRQKWYHLHQMVHQIYSTNKTNAAKWDNTLDLEVWKQSR